MAGRFLSDGRVLHGGSWRENCTTVLPANQQAMKASRKDSGSAAPASGPAAGAFSTTAGTGAIAAARQCDAVGDVQDPAFEPVCFALRGRWLQRAFCHGLHPLVCWYRALVI